MTDEEPLSDQDATDDGTMSNRSSDDRFPTALTDIDVTDYTVPYHVKGAIDVSTGGATGVIGRATAKTGLTNGVTGITESTERGAAGVFGYAGNGGLGAGVEGYISSAKDGSSGVFGSTGAPVVVETYGVEGKTFAHGDASNDQYPAGVYGRTTGSGSVHGVRGKTTSSEGVGVYGNAADSGGHGVYSDGDAHVAGTLTARERSVTNTGASVYHSYGQSIDDTTETRIDFNLLLYDDRNSYDLEADEFVVPTDGRYDVTVAALPEAAGSKATVEVKVNTATRVWNQQGASGSTYPHPVTKKTLSLNQGDSVVPYVWHNAGSTVPLYGDESATYLTITQVA